MQANACHIDGSSLRMRQGHSKITALAEAIGCAQHPQNQAVLLHGDLHARNLLINNEELVAMRPYTVVREPEQDIAEAVAKNDWGADLHLRAKQLAEACDADRAKVAAYTRVAARNAGLFHAGTGAETPGGVDPDELLAYAVRSSNRNTRPTGFRRPNRQTNLYSGCRTAAARIRNRARTHAYTHCTSSRSMNRT